MSGVMQLSSYGAILSYWDYTLPGMGYTVTGCSYRYRAAQLRGYSVIGTTPLLPGMGYTVTGCTVTRLHMHSYGVTHRVMMLIVMGLQYTATWPGCAAQIVGYSYGVTQLLMGLHSYSVGYLPVAVQLCLAWLCSPMACSPVTVYSLELWAAMVQGYPVVHGVAT